MYTWLIRSCKLEESGLLDKRKFVFVVLSGCEPYSSRYLESGAIYRHWLLGSLKSGLSMQ